MINNLATICSNIIKAQNLSPSDNMMVATKIIEILVSGKTTTTTAEPEKIKEPEKSKTKIAGPGLCHCAICGQIIYHRVNDIYDPMKTEDFLNSFKPTKDKYKLTKDTNFQNINGNMTVSCLECGADMSVPLIGNAIEHQYKSDIIV